MKVYAETGITGKVQRGYTEGFKAYAQAENTVRRNVALQVKLEKQASEKARRIGVFVSLPATMTKKVTEALQTAISWASMSFNGFVARMDSILCQRCVKPIYSEAEVNRVYGVAYCASCSAIARKEMAL